MLLGWQDSCYSDGLVADNKGLLTAGVGDHVQKDYKHSDMSDT